MKLFLSILLTALCAGCASQNNYVISGTGTVIGVEIGQNPATQMYHAKLGYVRAEIALVPTNKGQGTNHTGQAARDTANVLMELKYNGIFSASGGIYQRLAVGDIAVAQPGAAFMFAKAPDGSLDAGTAKAVSDAIRGIKPSPAASTIELLLPLAEAYQAGDKAKFDAAAHDAGYLDFVSFLTDKELTPEQVNKMKALLTQNGLLR